MNLYEQTQALKAQTAQGLSLARSGLVQQDLVKYNIPLDRLRTTITGTDKHAEEEDTPAAWVRKYQTAADLNTLATAGTNVVR